MIKPLAEKLRPDKIEDIVGQVHLFGENKILNKILKRKYIPNMIFYGPPGTGKTSVANIASKLSNKTLYKLNATNASTSDIKNIINDLDTMLAPNGAILYLDEIQNFNKKQQQSLLEFIETGKITLIASTSENPYFSIYNAILSRCNVFEFKLLDFEDILKLLKRAIEIFIIDGIKIEYDENALEAIFHLSNGDARKALNLIELLIYSQLTEQNSIFIGLEAVKLLSQDKSFIYDKNGDTHYDTLSGFQKSIRGSDPNAAVYYLAKLIKAGDLKSICRRLMVIAAEDIGLAYPAAISIIKSCVDAAQDVGLPEARIILCEATLLLATLPKSNSTIMAIDKALQELNKKGTYYVPGKNKFEESVLMYLKNINRF